MATEQEEQGESIFLMKCTRFLVVFLFVVFRIVCTLPGYVCKMDVLKTYHIHSREAVQKQLRSAPWTETALKCKDLNAPAGGSKATQMRTECTAVGMENTERESGIQTTDYWLQLDCSSFTPPVNGNHTTSGVLQPRFTCLCWCTQFLT